MAMFELRGIPIHAPDDLLASLPALWHFHPTRSLLVLCEQDIDSQNQFTDSARVELAACNHLESITWQLLQLAARSEADSVVLIVIDDEHDHEFHRTLIDTVTTAMTDIDVPVRAAIWASSTQQGAAWISYTDAATGSVADPRATILATQVAVAGRVVFGERDDLVALFAPRAEDAVAQRRASLIHDTAAAFLTRRAVTHQHAVADALTAIDTAITEAGSGNLPSSDEHIVQLCVALADPHVQGCVAAADPATSYGAETLWAALMREAPPGWRSNPASLLATHAFIRGDGVVANLALDLALREQPDHPIAQFMRNAIDTSAPLDDIANTLTVHAAQLRNQLSEG